MRRSLLRFGPRGIGGQIVVLVIAAVLACQLVIVILFTILNDRVRHPELSPPAMADRFAEFARILDRLPADTRASVAEAMRSAYPNLNLALVPREAALALPQRAVKTETEAEDRSLADYLRRVLGSELRPIILARDPHDTAAASPAQRIAAVPLRDGAALTGSVLAMGRPRNEPSPVAIVLITLGLITVVLTALLWWAARALTAPLARFSDAAGAFSLDRDPAPLPESDGPDEVRTASRALNRMQTRIRKMVEDRTRMLAAVSHDLRTPITRMRLRAEFLDHDEVRGPMLRDLDQMDAMVHGALSYLRDGQKLSTRALMDLPTLLQTICDDFADIGHDVAFDGPQHLLVKAHQDELQRAVTNLVDNALKHGGGRATVRLRAFSNAEVSIEVIDAGPGIPASAKDALLEPFARGDDARSMNEGSTGFGLGLAIVRATAEAHGGTLALSDAEPSGLIARLLLPCGPSRAERP